MKTGCSTFHHFCCCCCLQVDSTVDIETIEESKQEVAIARLKEVAQNKSPLLCTGKLENPSTRRRRNHSVTEKQRRLEQRALFDELQNVLGQPAGSKLHLLSMVGISPVSYSMLWLYFVDCCSFCHCAC